MAELKTKPTKTSVQAFLRGIDDEEKRPDRRLEDVDVAVLEKVIRESVRAAGRASKQ